ncbi:nose resistant to fluoxetine protein 6 [Drosophila innubila]|uniref:nose resistant to fluoxetine protein 6 n=1 Tax=Drosophila innubila TaxID=198719 RepID=UPI00148C05E3|nr:nose resistant to fluoxetine protein 6 [Drosophila innubila]
MMLQLLLVLLLPAIGRGLESHSLLEGITHLVASSSNAITQLTSCQRQLLALHDAWQRREAWALKAFDASGSGYDNFMLGNSLWLGSRVSCRAVNENVMRYYTTKQQHLHRNLAPFPFDYHLAYVRANSPWQSHLIAKEPALLHFGLCLPQICTRLELEEMLPQVLAAGGIHSDKFEMKPELVYTKQPQLKGDFFASKSFKLFLTLLACVLLLTLLATCGMAGGRIVSCFDAASNWQRLWQVSVGNHEIAVINGLRVLSALSILILHVSWYTSQSTDQSADLAMKVATIWLYHPYLPAMLEIFFTISGFLTVFNFLRNETLQRSITEDTILGNLSSILKQLVHRYLRLAPLQLVVILFIIVVFSYYQEVSVYHIFEPLDEICSRNWWQNMFLIQNMYPETMCANWTWSVACDMQLHVLATLLLFLYVRHPNFVRRLVLAILCGNVLYTVVLLIILDMDFKFDSVYVNLTTWFYFNPLVRMLPYVIGSIYGYTHVRGWSSPAEVLLPNKLTKCLLAVVVFLLFQQLQAEELQNSAVLASGIIMIRTIISVFAAQLVLASFKIEQSSALIRWLVDFLQSKCFQFVGRVTFAFYLLNPLIIYCFNFTFGNVLPADISMLSILAIAHTFIVLVLAIFLTLFFEMPLNRLTSLLLSSNSSKSKQN